MAGLVVASSAAFSILLGSVGWYGNRSYKEKVTKSENLLNSILQNQSETFGLFYEIRPPGIRANLTSSIDNHFKRGYGHILFRSRHVYRDNSWETKFLRSLKDPEYPMALIADGELLIDTEVFFPGIKSVEKSMLPLLCYSTAISSPYVVRNFPFGTSTEASNYYGFSPEFQIYQQSMRYPNYAFSAFFASNYFQLFDQGDFFENLEDLYDQDEVENMINGAILSANLIEIYGERQGLEDKEAYSKVAKLYQETQLDHFLHVLLGHEPGPKDFTLFYLLFSTLNTREVELKDALEMAGELYRYE